MPPPLITSPTLAAQPTANNAVLADSANDKSIALLRLMRTVPVERREVLSVEGHLPAELVGCLYRVGPADAGRDPRPFGHVLDGDGMLHHFLFSGSEIRFANRFVRTEKFVAEGKARRTLYPTWSRKAPGWWSNVGTKRIRSQASVTVMDDGARLLVRDEVGLPWIMDRDGLDTLGQLPEGPNAGAEIRNRRINPKAHVKINPVDGSRISVACAYGRKAALHVMRHDRSGCLLRRRIVPLPLQVYFHDFFATGGTVVLALVPLEFRPLPFLAGLKSFSDCLHWRTDPEMTWLVVDLQSDAPARFLSGPSAWTWHTVNAYVDGDRLIADWIGYDAPDHFVGPDAALRTMARLEPGRSDHPGLFRRTIIDIKKDRLHQETLVDGNFEFPTIAPEASGLPYAEAFVTVAGPTLLADGVARIEPSKQIVDQFRFGTGTYVGEPLPAGLHYVLVPGLDSHSERSFLAIFRRNRISDGPLAMAWHSRPLPATFHGFWRPDQGLTST